MKALKSINLEDRKIEWFALVSITFLGAILRFYKLGYWSYWVDELYSLRAVSRPIEQIFYKPFWLMIKFTVESLGADGFSLRILPCIFGVITIPLLYFPFKIIFNKRVALVAIFFLTISPWHIYLSQLARWYSLLLLVSTFALFSFYFYIEKNQIKFLVASGILFLIAFRLHLTAGFVLIIAFVYLLILLIFKKLQPDHFNTVKVKKFLALICLAGLLLIPKFLEFVKIWSEMQKNYGYWGSTPVNFTMKVLYHLTPTMAVIAVFGLILLLFQKNRLGVFFALYCILPPLILNLAAIFKTNVSAKYVFFTLPGLVLLIGYFVCFVIDQIKLHKPVFSAALVLAVALPALQTDYLYFTTGFGNRDRLKEAMKYIKELSTPDDKIFPLYVFENPVEAQFYCQTTARLSGFDIEDEQFLFPERPEDLDLDQRIWVVSIGKPVPPYPTGFYKWVADHTHLLAEFKAWRGPQDNTVRVFLHNPYFDVKSTRLVVQ